VNLRIAFACLIATGCAFGGEDGDPTDGIVANPPPETMDGGGSGGDDGDGDGDKPSPPKDASTRSDASADDAGRRDGGSTLDGGGANMCMPAKALDVCDPVKNTGCLIQCDLDPAATTAQAGRCVGYFPPILGPCSPGADPSACTGTNTCVAGACRKMCYCDADCESGTKCTDAVPGAAGPVKLCK
jgi:hypothetical protein